MNEISELEYRRWADSPLKAVVFTHFGSLRFGLRLRDFQMKQNELIATYKEIIKAYLKCSEVAIVYAYVDWAVQQTVLQIRQTQGLHFTIEGILLDQERSLIDLLHLAEREARQEIGSAPGDGPKFHYIGINDLISLLNSLVEVDPQLVSFLCGREGKFTYDSPKFVEAVIRLARGHTGHLARHPVVRIDEDVEPTSHALKLMLGAYQQISHKEPFVFFSGQYGGFNGEYDPVNDHAVRVHWFVDPSTKAINLDAIRMFLADLSELGATQLIDSSTHHSSALRELLTLGKRSPLPKRSAPQVISGAGLIMTSRAVNLLPPFMNFEYLTTWVDDHLKRRLHENLWDLSANAPECVAEARLRQNRHPDGITKRDVEWAEQYYFDRLLRGCLFTRILTRLDSEPTSYSKLVGDIVRFRVSETNDPVNVDLATEMMSDSESQYDHVLRCWTSDEFRGYASFQWASRRTAEHRSKACEAVVQDAANYIHLLRRWPVFTRAIERLPFVGNLWLYEPID